MSAAGAAAPAQAVSAGVGGDAAPSFATGPAVGDGPYGPGSHGLLADPRQIPEGFPIKGNADSMLYHRPDSRNYGATGAEVYFDSADRAEAAGFGLAPTHPKD